MQPTHGKGANEFEAVGVGFYFEDLVVGRRWRTPGRTVTESDINAFLNVIHMTSSLFTDLQQGDNTYSDGARLAPGALVYCCGEGLLSRSIMQGSRFPLLSMELEMGKPVVAGDTIHVECEVTESRSVGDRLDGLVRLRSNIVNGDGTVVLTYTPLRSVKRRDSTG